MSDFAKRIAEIVEQLEAAQALISKLKPDFEAFIKDKSISLEERWQTFASAPDYLRNKEPWVEHLEIGGREICWYNDFYVERYQDVNMVDIIECMFENVGEDSYKTVDYTVEDIKVLQEEILDRNLGSFNNDW